MLVGLDLTRSYFRRDGVRTTFTVATAKLLWPNSHNVSYVLLVYKLFCEIIMKKFRSCISYLVNFQTRVVLLVPSMEKDLC